MSRGEDEKGNNDSNQVTEYRKKQKRKITNQIYSHKKRFTSLIKYIISNIAIFLFILSIFTTIIGIVIFDISPFQPLEEIAAKQSEYRKIAADDVKKSEIVSDHLKLGNTFLSVLQLDAANIEFDEALKLDPLNLSARRGLLKSEIFKPIVEGDYDPEITEKRLMLILQEDPDDPHALLFLGSIYSPIDTERAIEYYHIAIDKDPSIAAAYFGIGFIYDEQNRYDEALIMYEKALSLSKWNQLFLDNLGHLYYLRNEYNKSIEKYELLLRLNENYLPAYYTISNTYRLTGNMEQARLDQETVIKLLGDENVTRLKRNEEPWFFSFGSDKVNFFDYSKKKSYAYYNIALTYYLLGNESEAKGYLKKAKDLHLDKESELDVKRLIYFDIGMLGAKQPALLNRTEEFMREFME
ncbi:MAG TPA: tetratricopeptide repeat protein [Candidatus Methanoperedens sp.]|nr:tetratricopeptide repeat protein [Candidatus Methanoperedens sp.]HLB71309.1 tetratricopeptide repeat protein [Candidatus Methanoperedens sp.]